jgi:hypothetical protein
MGFGKYCVYLGFAASLLVVGIPYWLVPYSKVSLPDTLMGPQLIVVVGAAAFAYSVGNVSFRKSLAIIGASVPAAVFLRVAVATAIDPTSHNLWPIEIVIAAFVGLVCASIGGALGVLLTKTSLTRGT